MDGLKDYVSSEVAAKANNTSGISQSKDTEAKTLNVTPSTQQWNPKILKKLAQRLITDSSSLLNDSTEDEGCLATREGICYNSAFALRLGGTYINSYSLWIFRTGHEWFIDRS